MKRYPSSKVVYLADYGKTAAQAKQSSSSPPSSGLSIDTMFDEYWSWGPDSLQNVYGRPRSPSGDTSIRFELRALSEQLRRETELLKKKLTSIPSPGITFGGSTTNTYGEMKAPRSLSSSNDFPSTSSSSMNRSPSRPKVPSAARRYDDYVNSYGVVTLRAARSSPTVTVMRGTKPSSSMAAKLWARLKKVFSTVTSR